MKKVLSFVALGMGVSLQASMPSSCACWAGDQFEYGLNPPILCPVDDCGTFGVWGEFLWLRAVQDNTFAYQQINLTGAEVTTNDFDYTEGFKRTKFDPDWEASFRIGALYALPCDQWGIEADWLYFYNKSSKISPELSVVADGTSPVLYNGSVASLPYQVGYGFFSPSGVTSNDFSTLVQSSFKVRINEVNANLTRQFFVGPLVRFKPYVGFKGLFVEESIHAQQTVTYVEDNFVTNVNQMIKSDANGYGGQAGFLASFDLCWGLSLYGDIQGAVLWTHYNNHFTQNLTQSGDTSDGGSLITTNKESLDVMRYNGAFKGGIEWACRYDCHQNVFFVRLGWEHHLYLTQNTISTLFSRYSISGGAANNQIGSFFREGGDDLSLYGLSVAVGLTF